MSQIPVDLVRALRTFQFYCAGGHDPRVIPTYGSKGVMYIRVGKDGGDIFSKLDDGNTTNWKLNSATGSIDIFQEIHTVTPSEFTVKQFNLNLIPVHPSRALVSPIGGSIQEWGLDYNIVGNVFSWNGLRLDGQIAQGNKILIRYA